MNKKRKKHEKNINNWDLTDEWLEKNDVYYNDMDKNKRNKLEYSYETKRMEKTRKKVLGELPFSVLWEKNLYKLSSRGIDINKYK